MDLVRRRVSVSGEEIVLVARETTCSRFLIRRNGQMQYVRVHVGHIGQTLGPAAARLIRTETGIGYRLVDAYPA